MPYMYCNVCGKRIDKDGTCEHSIMGQLILAYEHFKKSAMAEWGKEETPIDMGMIQNFISHTSMNLYTSDVISRIWTFIGSGKLPDVNNEKYKGDGNFVCVQVLLADGNTVESIYGCSGAMGEVDSFGTANLTAPVIAWRYKL